MAKWSFCWLDLAGLVQTAELAIFLCFFCFGLKTGEQSLLPIHFETQNPVFYLKKKYLCFSLSCEALTCPGHRDWTVSLLFLLFGRRSTGWILTFFFKHHLPCHSSGGREGERCQMAISSFRGRQDKCIPYQRKSYQLWFNSWHIAFT